METREIGPKLAGLAVGGLYTFGNLGGAVGPLVVELLETSSTPYMLSQLILLGMLHCNGKPSLMAQDPQQLH
ncbi:MAG: hypothetical protein KIH01_09115 [Candidatus Freyarchaeota archaeon]|nr:hypothetical protein [Candidatus Jordarchaeia archaeon]